MQSPAVSLGYLDERLNTSLQVVAQDTPHFVGSACRNQESAIGIEQNRIRGRQAADQRPDMLAGLEVIALHAS